MTWRAPRRGLHLLATSGRAIGQMTALNRISVFCGSRIWTPCLYATTQRATAADIRNDVRSRPVREEGRRS